MNQPLSDIALRHRKAVKILHALSRETTKPLSSLSCVDIGCAYGLITESLAEHFQYTLGVDSNPANLQEAKQLTRPKLGFIQADARQLPLKSDSVDIVICAQVYEHVAHNDLLFEEIWRILKPTGICFFSGPNRLYPFEYHWQLPLLHWLPLDSGRRLAEQFRRKPMPDLHLLTYWSLRRLTRNFIYVDYTTRMIHNPEQFAMSQDLKRWRWMSRLPLGLLDKLIVFVPNFNWLLVKPGEH